MTKTPITEKAERECRSIDEVFDRIRSLETAAQGLRDALEKIRLGFVPDSYKEVARKALARFDALKEGK